MPSDDERDSKATKLKDRDGFFAWKRTMRLVAMDKGDVYGIFDEDGTKGTYAAIPVGAGGAVSQTSRVHFSMPFYFQTKWSTVDHRRATRTIRNFVVKLCG